MLLLRRGVISADEAVQVPTMAINRHLNYYIYDEKMIILTGKYILYSSKYLVVNNDRDVGF